MHNQKYAVKLNDETGAYQIWIASNPEHPSAKTLKEARTECRERAQQDYDVWRKQVRYANESQSSIHDREAQPAGG